MCLSGLGRSVGGGERGWASGEEGKPTWWLPCLPSCPLCPLWLALGTAEMTGMLLVLLYASHASASECTAVLLRA